MSYPFANVSPELPGDLAQLDPNNIFTNIIFSSDAFRHICKPDYFDSFEWVDIREHLPVNSHVPLADGEARGVEEEAVMSLAISECDVSSSGAVDTAHPDIISLQPVVSSTPKHENWGMPTGMDHKLTTPGCRASVDVIGLMVGEDSDDDKVRSARDSSSAGTSQHALECMLEGVDVTSVVSDGSEDFLVSDADWSASQMDPARSVNYTESKLAPANAMESKDSLHVSQSDAIQAVRGPTSPHAHSLPARQQVDIIQTLEKIVADINGSSPMRQEKQQPDVSYASTGVRSRIMRAGLLSPLLSAEIPSGMGLQGVFSPKMSSKQRQQEDQLDHADALVSPRSEAVVETKTETAARLPVFAPLGELTHGIVPSGVSVLSTPSVTNPRTPVSASQPDRKLQQHSPKNKLETANEVDANPSTAAVLVSPMTALVGGNTFGAPGKTLDGRHVPTVLSPSSSTLPTPPSAAARLVALYDKLDKQYRMMEAIKYAVTPGEPHAGSPQFGRPSVSPLRERNMLTPEGAHKASPLLLASTLLSATGSPKARNGSVTPLTFIEPASPTVSSPPVMLGHVARVVTASSPGSMTGTAPPIELSASANAALHGSALINPNLLRDPWEKPAGRV